MSYIIHHTTQRAFDGLEPEIDDADVARVSAEITEVKVQVFLRSLAECASAQTGT